jgi:hypothetical protein
MTIEAREDQDPASPNDPGGTLHGRLAIFAAIVVLALLTSVLYVLHARGRGEASDGGAVRATSAVGALAPRPHLLFRSASTDRDYGRLALVALDRPGGRPAVTSLRCDRVDFAAGRGVCLSLEQSNWRITSEAVVFDQRFRRVSRLELPGYPSRTRVSPDGRHASTTTFVSGDSYASVGFSTRTDILDLRRGKRLFSLEELDVRRDGKRIRAIDVNFWGVTFANDGRHFYATLATGGQTYLIKGDLTTRRAEVLRGGIECPSLSPDNTKIAFKSRVPGTAVRWKLAVLDLATLRSHPVAESRDIDDQPQWLDDQTVMYGLTRPVKGNGVYTPPGVPLITQGSQVAADTWAVPADGTGEARKLISGAWSAVAVHVP